MSYTTITQCTNDEAFRDRVTAGAMKEAISSAVYGETAFGKQLLVMPSLALSAFIWPLAVDNEAAYEYAVNAANPNPGGDPTVITDANIQSGIQAHWPPDPTPPQPAA